MERLVKNTLELFHSMIQAYVLPGDTVLDATAGNGHDTLLLAKCIGQKGKVHAIDIQPVALENTSKRLLEAGLMERVELYCMDHANIADLGLSKLSLAIFNLGYLPGSSKEIATSGESTTKALTAVLDLLKPMGIILITVYPGSELGWQEHSELDMYWKTLDQRIYDVVELKFPNRKNVSPYGIMIQKLR
ncbi:class I SAM-dependent methyltransferase [Clostridia bacterium]|nr:class I SAM-dependent methyltransferase [Clostridia bacterium]